MFCEVKPSARLWLEMRGIPLFSRTTYNFEDINWLGNHCISCISHSPKVSVQTSLESQILPLGISVTFLVWSETLLRLRQ